MTRFAFCAAALLALAACGPPAPPDFAASCRTAYPTAFVPYAECYRRGLAEAQAFAASRGISDIIGAVSENTALMASRVQSGGLSDQEAFVAHANLMVSARQMAENRVSARAQASAARSAAWDGLIASGAALTAAGAPRPLIAPSPTIRCSTFGWTTTCR